MISRNYLGAILASTSASLGGMTVVLTRYLMPDSDAFSLPGARYFIGGIVLFLIFAIIKKLKPLEIVDWKAILFLSFSFYVAFPIAFAAGLEHTTAARGAIVFTAQPIITLILGLILGTERTNLFKVLAMFIAIAGISVTLSDKIGDEAPNALMGDFLMFTAAFFNSLYLVKSRNLIIKYGTYTFAVWPMLIGSSMMLFLALFFGNPLSGSLSFDAHGWMVLLILAIPGVALMQYIFQQAIIMSSPTGVSMTVGFNPLWSIILGAIILHEPISSKILFGFLCIVVAVILANYEKKNIL